MADLLVRLYDLPPVAPLLEQLAESRLVVRRAHPREGPLVEAWVRQHFNEVWAAETASAFDQRPIPCFVAAELGASMWPGSDDPYNQPVELMLGFACYDTSARGFFGPTGVREDQRGRGLGKALLLACLYAMYAEGYAYAIIGWAGPVEFYVKTVGAAPIPGSEPGIYRGPLVI
jgi:GNAT superfamily N-acetyltransferase